MLKTYFNMQPFKVRSVFSFAAINKNIIRSVGVSGPVVEENVKQVQDLKPWKEIPGPSSLPFLGPIISFLPGGKLAGCKGIELSKRLHTLYGPIVRFDGVFGAKNMIMLSDPETVEYVFRSEELTPIRPGIQSLEYYRKRHNKVYDPTRLTGLASDHGENWREFRSKVNPIMMQPKTIKLYTDALEDVANDMVKRLRLIRDSGTIKKKFNVEMNLWALESISVVALGTRLNCFDPNLPADSPARRLIQNVHDVFDMAEKLDFAPSFWRLYATPLFKKAMKTYEENESLTKYFIDQAIKKLEESKKYSTENSNSEKPVLEKLLEIDIRVAQIMASDMLLAGVDTASNTAIATLYLLALNKEKQNKLREEIFSKETRRPYLRACIKEAMRMLPVVNGNLRLSTKEYNLLGYRIPKDVLIGFSHQYMSILEEHYPKTDEFIPERWLTDKDDPLYHGNAHRFAMAPFGFGIRMCIGRRIAELEMETLISKVIENFDVDWTSDEPVQVAPTLLNYITGPFHFLFKDL